MNYPGLSFWSHLVGMLAIEIAALTALGFFAQWRLRRAGWKQSIWQITVACMLMVTASEWIGFGRGAAAFLAGPQLMPSTAPAPTITTIKSGDASRFPLPTRNEPPVPAATNVWWPGWLWLAGTVLVLGRLLACQSLLLTLRLRREEIGGGLLRERVLSVAKSVGLRRNVSLLCMPGSISPMAFGILRPGIGLPHGFEAKFTVAEQEAILAHELAHLTAMDPMWFLLADLTSAVLWWNPFTWWARRSLRVSSELAADEASLLLPDGPGSLAKCLVVLGKEMTSRRRWGWVGIDGGFRSSLGKRVERLTRMSGHPSRRNSSWFATTGRIAVMILGVPAIVLLCGAFRSADGRTENSLRGEMLKSWRNSPGALLMLAASSNKQIAAINDRLENAKSLYEMGNLNEAGKMFSGTFKDSPGNPVVSYYLGLIRDARRIESSRNGDLKPIPLATNKIAFKLLDAGTGQKVTIATRVQDAKLYFEMGKLDQAQANLLDVLREDPSNTTAPYYLDLIKEARFTSGRKHIIDKLEHIRLDRVGFVLPLPEVLNSLRTESRKADPDGVGIHFLINPYSDAAVKSSVDITSDVPAGAVAVAAPVPPIDMSAVTINIAPPLSNLRLYDVLNAIVMSADKPIEYKVEDYAVVFSPRPSEAITLYSKLFHVDPNTFVQALQQVSAVTVNSGNQPSRGDGYQGLERGQLPSRNQGGHFVTKTNNTVQLDQLVRSYFTAVGVDLSDPGKSVFFNDRLGLILVRATANDLHLIEYALNELGPSQPQGTAPAKTEPMGPQVMITTRFIKADKASVQGLAVDWLRFPGEIAELTDSQSRLALDQIERLAGVDSRPFPTVSTLSGRRVHISVEQLALDILPEVRSDGFSIDTTAKLTQNGENQPLNWDIYTFRDVRDGDTLVARNTGLEPNKVWLIFITPRIIDSAGSPVHNDEDLSRKR